MSDALLGAVLRGVSRSFYLSLVILPRGLREPIGLAYLLARAADTVADTRTVARAERLQLLHTLRDAYAGASVDLACVVSACAPSSTRAAERRLLERLPEALARLARLPAADGVEVRAVLQTLTSGMIFDLDRFPGEDAGHVAALHTRDELDEYIYLVAGCVGPFWTKLHVAHRRRLSDWDLTTRSEQAVRFGKALQLTNVLRDVPADLHHGRCYLPALELQALGLLPTDLLDATASVRALPLLHDLRAAALEHYDMAWRYTLAIPRAEWRMRLACVWPLEIGLRTLARLAAHPNPLAVPTPIKIPRREVRGLLARSLVSVWSDRALAAGAARLEARVAR
jgi:farnesyl-diphosphate farnesyltransferase